MCGWSDKCREPRRGNRTRRLDTHMLSTQLLCGATAKRAISHICASHVSRTMHEFAKVTTHRAACL